MDSMSEHPCLPFTTSLLFGTTPAGSFRPHYDAIPHSPIDNLPHLKYLEVLEAHGLQLLTYAIDTELVLVRTLKRISLRHTSIRWMVCRRFKKIGAQNLEPGPGAFHRNAGD
jgi:hypothetical protein